MTISTEQIQSLYDATIIDSDGSKIGGVGQVYLDDQSGEPSWVTAKTGMFGTKETFVPLQGASLNGDEIRVPFTKEFIKDAPNIDGEGHLDDNDQSNLFDYYNLDAAGAGTGPVGGQNADAGTADSARTDAGGNVEQRRDADRDAGGVDTADRNTSIAGTADRGAGGLGTTDPDAAGIGPADRGAMGEAGAADQGVADRAVTDRGTTDRGTHGRNARGSAGDDVDSNVATGTAATPGSDSTTGGDRPSADRTEQAPAGSKRGGMRIRKHVVTEQQTVTVPVEREVIELVPDPDTDSGTAGTQSGEPAHGGRLPDDGSLSGRHAEDTDPTR